MNPNLLSVYQIHGIVDVREYEGFGWKDFNHSFLRNHGDFSTAYDDFVPNYFNNQSVPQLLKDVWLPKEVEGDVAKWNDYPTIDLSLPAFSKRAVSALRDFLEPNGELLPIIYKGAQDYFAYNVTTIVNVLDRGRTHRIYSTKIERYEFNEALLGNLSFFRLEDEATFYFVTQPFVDRVIEHELQGFSFDKLWPLPEGVDWWTEHKKRWKWRRYKVAKLRRRAGVKRLPYPPLEPGE